MGMNHQTLGVYGTRFSTLYKSTRSGQTYDKTKMESIQHPLQSSTNRPLLYIIVRYVKLPEGVSAVFMVQSPLIIQIGNGYV